MLIIKIQNDGTGTPEIGNYRYQVMVNDTVIESGEVKGHERKEGWRGLLLNLVDTSSKKELENLIGLCEEAK
jgi:hypothetical protein